MKQHITVEQLLKLSDDELITLFEIMHNIKITHFKNHLEHFYYKIHRKGFCFIDAPRVSFNLNIGKMIEILGHKVNTLRYNEEWTINIGTPSLNNFDITDTFNNIELCDALWNAIKEVLKKEY